MTKFTQKSFTVAAPGTKEYADNWERTFRGCTVKAVGVEVGCCGARMPETETVFCTRKPGHSGAHEQQHDDNQPARVRWYFSER